MKRLRLFRNQHKHEVDTTTAYLLFVAIMSMSAHLMVQ